ncbi:MAG TPA: hypothetical protein VIS10_00375, partial [Anaerolineales bacterium]
TAGICGNPSWASSNIRFFLNCFIVSSIFRLAPSPFWANWWMTILSFSDYGILFANRQMGSLLHQQHDNSILSEVVS